MSDTESITNPQSFEESVTTEMIQENIDLLTEKRRQIKENALKKIQTYLNHTFCDYLLTDIYETCLDSLLSVVKKGSNLEFQLGCECLCSLFFTSGAEWEDAIVRAYEIFEPKIRSEEIDEKRAIAVITYSVIVFVAHVEEMFVNDLLKLLMNVLADKCGGKTAIQVMKSILLLVSNSSEATIHDYLVKCYPLVTRYLEDDDFNVRIATYDFLKTLILNEWQIGTINSSNADRKVCGDFYKFYQVVTTPTIHGAKEVKKIERANIANVQSAIFEGIDNTQTIKIKSQTLEIPNSFIYNTYEILKATFHSGIQIHFSDNPYISHLLQISLDHVVLSTHDRSKEKKAKIQQFDREKKDRKLKRQSARDRTDLIRNKIFDEDNV